VWSKICEVSSTNGTDINKKCEDCLIKMNCFHIHKKMSKVLFGDVSTLKGIPEDLTSTICCIKNMHLLHPSM